MKTFQKEMRKDINQLKEWQQQIVPLIEQLSSSKEKNKDKKRQKLSQKSASSDED